MELKWFVLFCALPCFGLALGNEAVLCPADAATDLECPLWFSNTGAQLTDSQANMGTTHNLLCVQLVEKNCGAKFDIYSIASTRANKLVKLLITYETDKYVGPQVYYLYTELVTAQKCLGYRPPESR